MGRILVGIILGALAALAVAFAVDLLAATLFPRPPGIDLLTGWRTGGTISAMPRAAKLVLAAGWAAGAFLGGAIAVRWGHRPIDAYVVAGFVVAQALVRSYAIVAPGRLVAAALLVPWAAGWAAARLTRLPHR